MFSKEEFKVEFIKYVGENSTNCFTSLDEMQDWEWTSYYNMYKCGNSMGDIMDFLHEEVYGEEL